MAIQPQSAPKGVSSDTENFQSATSLVVTPFTTDEWHKADAYTMAGRPAVVADAKAYIKAHVRMTQHAEYLYNVQVFFKRLNGSQTIENCVSFPQWCKKYFDIQTENEMRNIYIITAKQKKLLGVGSTPKPAVQTEIEEEIVQPAAAPMSDKPDADFVENKPTLDTWRAHKIAVGTFERKYYADAANDFVRRHEYAFASNTFEKVLSVVGNPKYADDLAVMASTIRAASENLAMLADVMVVPVAIGTPKKPAKSATKPCDKCGTPTRNYFVSHFEGSKQFRRYRCNKCKYPPTTTTQSSKDTKRTKKLAHVAMERMVQ